MRARFGISNRLEYYSTELLATIVKGAQILNVPVDSNAAIEIADEVGVLLGFLMDYRRKRLCTNKRKWQNRYGDYQIWSKSFTSRRLWIR